MTSATPMHHLPLVVLGSISWETEILELPLIELHCFIERCYLWSLEIFSSFIHHIRLLLSTCGTVKLGVGDLLQTSVGQQIFVKRLGLWCRCCGSLLLSNITTAGQQLENPFLLFNSITFYSGQHWVITSSFIYFKILIKFFFYIFFCHGRYFKTFLYR